MRDRGVATRYAAALLDAAQRGRPVDGGGRILRAVASAVAATPEAAVFLEGPQVADGEKKELLRSVLRRPGRAAAVLNFFLLLIDKNRIEYPRGHRRGVRAAGGEGAGLPARHRDHGGAAGRRTWSGGSRPEARGA